MIYILWQFKIKPEKRDEFERVYYGRGKWAELFRRDPAFVETRLARDVWRKDTYLCIDVWKDLQSYHDFQVRHHADYEKLDRECEALTEEEISTGIFEDL